MSIITIIFKITVDHQPLITQVDNYVNHEDYGLENLDLLQAVSSEGRYRLKIETDAKVYIIQRQKNMMVNSKSQDPVTETKDNFLIWIKCQGLN